MLTDLQIVLLLIHEYKMKVLIYLVVIQYVGLSLGQNIVQLKILPTTPQKAQKAGHIQTISQQKEKKFNFFIALKMRSSEFFRANTLLPL